MRPKTLTTSAITADLDGVVVAAAPSAAVPMTLATTTLSPPRRLIFDASGDMAAVVFTIVGKDRYGNAQTSTVTGVTTVAVTTTDVWSSVTSITPSASDADTLTVGWSDESIGAPLVLDNDANPFNIGLGLVVTGTVSCSVQHTFQNLLLPDVTENDVTWFDHDSIAAVSASADGNYAFGVDAIRLVQLSGTGSAVLYVIQSGI